MIDAPDFWAECKSFGFDFFSGTPCSYLKPLINAAIDDPSLGYFGASNEGDAVAMACGAYVAGKKGVVMFQNSGLGNAVNALTSLAYPFRIPLLLIVTHRGHPEEPPDEPQHELMGTITKSLLEVLEIPWERFPDDPEEVPGLLSKISHHIDTHRLPYALVMRKGSVRPRDLKNEKPVQRAAQRIFAYTETLSMSYEDRALSSDVLKLVLKHKRPGDILVATTGYTGRELYTLEDAPAHFYMVGSMGSASSFALGMALMRPERRLVVLDGDGAALMRMGNLASVGACRCNNYLHIILDNEAYASTGGQATGSEHVSFAMVAKACSYERVYTTDSMEDLERLLAQKESPAGPVLIHVKIRSGVMPDLGRPKIRPFEVKERLMKECASIRNG